MVRTQLANERTLLAYARTVVMLLVTGATVLKFYGGTTAGFGGGALVLAVALGVAGVGLRRFLVVARALGS
ncbi:MAG: DUF202 domain-containing protein [Planctomycetota bacterium]